MKRFVCLFGIAASMTMLAACGNPYDDGIDQVIQLENENLDKPSTETDIDTLERDDAQIWGYNDGEYIELQYVIRGELDTNNPVYKYNQEEEEYERYTEGDFSSSEIDNLEPDYTENVDNDDS